jgi:hypothetical protein
MHLRSARPYRFAGKREWYWKPCSIKPYTGSLENIYINAQTQMLLLYSLDCMLGEKEIDVVNCKFLANELDREKIVKAREVLIQHIGEPITIKELKPQSCHQ